MLVTVEKKGIQMELRDESQVAAFIGSGWKIMKTPKKAEPKEEAKKEVKRLTPEEVDKLTYAGLQKYAKSLGINTFGKKQSELYKLVLQ